VRSGIKLTVGREAVVELVLTPGEVAEKITVTGKRRWWKYPAPAWAAWWTTAPSRICR
jgi:hypothetical protein